jgi:hypothetical protein
MVSPDYFIYLMQFFYSAILERGLSVRQRIFIVRCNKKIAGASKLSEIRQLAQCSVSRGFLCQNAALTTSL